MNVDASAYKVFFDQLKKHFIQTELKGKLPRKARGEKSRFIWDFESGINEGKGFAIAKLFLNSNISNPQYFQRRYDDLHRKGVKEGAVDSQVMVNAFEYLGLKPPAERLDSYNKISPDNKADLLYSEFVRINQDLIKRQMDIDAAEPPNGVLQGTDVIINNLEPKNSSMLTAQSVIIKFYECIARLNLDIAWGLLTNEFKNKQPWLGNIEKFKVGYTNTSGIRNINLFAINQIMPDIIECSLSYDDEILIYTNRYLSDLDTLTIGDIDEFTNKVKSLKAHLEKNNVENLDKVELVRLFDPTASEYIWYKCGIDKSELPSIFNSPKTMIIKRLSNVTCCLVNGEWLINRIYTSRTVPIR